VVGILEPYLQKFRPFLVTDALFVPARQGGAKTPAQLTEQSKHAIMKGIGLTVNSDLFRRICAYPYLKAHPGDYETVRLLLGHTTLATTVRAYFGLERSDAVRRYDSLIDTYRRTKGSESHARRCLPMASWPERDRLAWEAGTRCADLFDERNAGADWSLSSRQKTARDNQARSLEASRRHITLRDSFDNGGGQETR
jgi:hypothetical protein